MLIDGHEYNIACTVNFYVITFENTPYEEEKDKSLLNDQYVLVS